MPKFAKFEDPTSAPSCKICLIFDISLKPFAMRELEHTSLLLTLPRAPPRYFHIFPLSFSSSCLLEPKLMFRHAFLKVFPWAKPKNPTRFKIP